MLAAKEREEALLKVRQMVNDAAAEVLRRVSHELPMKLDTETPAPIDVLLKSKHSAKRLDELVPKLIKQLDAMDTKERLQFAVVSFSSEVFRQKGALPAAVQEAVARFVPPVGMDIIHFSKGTQLLLVVNKYAQFDEAVATLFSDEPAIVAAAAWRLLEGVYKDPQSFIQLQSSYQESFPELLTRWKDISVVHYPLYRLSLLPWGSSPPVPDWRLSFTRAQDTFQKLLLFALHSVAGDLPFYVREAVTLSTRFTGFWWGMFMLRGFSPGAAERFYRGVVVRLDELGENLRREFLKRYEGVEMLRPALLMLDSRT